MGILDDAFSLNKSGGIYFEGERVNSFSKHNYLFVGLGGTGTDALIRVKNQVHNRMKLPVDPVTKMPTAEVPDNMAFLAFDTDDAVNNTHYGNTSFAEDGSEVLTIGAKGADYQTVINELIDDKESGMKYAQWIHKDTKANGGAAGAGGRRSVGRVGFFKNYTGIYSAIDQKLTELSLKNPKVDCVKIFLFTGISGGTGSGTFIDMGYTLRKIGLIHDPQCQLHGYIFLTDVNLLSGGRAADMKANAFASLKELDYLTESGKFREHMFVQEYDSVSSNVNGDVPFNYCHLIDATDDKGISHSKDDVMNSVAESVFSFVADEPGLGAATLPGLQSLYDNIDAYFLTNSTLGRYPAFYEYLSIGSELIKVPYMEINTLIACRMFERLNKSIFNNKVTDIKFIEDMKSLGLGAGKEKLQDSLSALLEAKSPVMHQLNTKMYDYDSIWGQSNKAYKDAYHDAQQYQNAMNACSGTAPGNLEGKLRNFLKSAFVESSRGPIYLAELISGFGSDNLIGLLEKQKKYFSDICEQETSVLVDVQRELEDIHARYDNVHKLDLIKKEKASREYLSMLKSWRTKQLLVDKYHYLSILCGDLVGIYNKYYDKILFPMKSTLEEIKNIFVSNLKFLDTQNTAAQMNRDKSIIVYPFEFERQYQQQFDDCVQNAENGFLNQLLNDMTNWIRCDIDHVDVMIATNPDIPGFLSKFVSSCFASFYASINMETILTPRIPAGGNITSYSQSVIKDLYNRAYPLFKKSATASETHEVAILSVPSNCHNIVQAAFDFQKVVGVPNLIVKQSAEQNCISIVKVKSGYALYNNAFLSDWEKQYELFRGSKATSIYLHLNENWSDKFPSPNIELGWTGVYECERTKLRNKKYRAMFDRCNKEGLIDKEETQKEAVLKLADETINLENVQLFGGLAARERSYQILKKQLWDSEVVVKKGIHGLGVYKDNGSEEGQLENIRENVLRDPELCNALEKQCKKLDQLEKLHRAILYPQFFVMALLCNLFEYDKFKQVILLKHMPENDPTPFVLVKDSGVSSIDPNSNTYYFDLYKALYPVLPTSSSTNQGRTWIEQVKQNWQAKTTELRDEKEALRVKNNVVKYGNMFKRYSDIFKHQASVSINDIDIKTNEEIADFYNSAFDALGMIHNKFFN